MALLRSALQDAHDGFDGEGCWMNKIDLDVASRHWAVNPLAGPVVLVTTVNAHGFRLRPMNLRHAALPQFQP